LDHDRIRAAAQLLVDAALASGPPKPAGPPFARLWERYFAADVKEQLRSAKDIARIGRQLVAAWGDRPSGSLSTEDAAAYRIERTKTQTRRLRPPAAQTLDNELSQARRCLNWAVKEKLLVYNPLANLELVRPDNARKSKVKTEGDLKALLDACDEVSPDGHLRALVLVYIDSGLRRMEAINLQWPQLEVWEREGVHFGVVELFRTKSRNKKTKRRRSGLSPRALQAILDLPRVGRHVFANPRTKQRYNPRWLYRLFERAVVASGLEGIDGEKICFHTLRHSFAYLRRVVDKVPERSVMRQGGWSDPKVFHRYGIEDDEEILSMFEAIDRRRRGPVRAGPEHADTYRRVHVGDIVKGP
jgi:integrase